jgi:bis(5'-nucleosidyl)-tetraphosphatase
MRELRRFFGLLRMMAASEARFNDRRTSEQVRASGFFVFRRNETDAFRNVEFLMMHATKGLWTPPKGHLEPGESDMDAAFRETEEESGLQKTALHVYETLKLELKYPNEFGKPKTVIYWLAELIDRNATIRLSDEHIDSRWCTLDEALALTKYENMQSALRDAFAKLKEHKLV